jgi:hypothetical protein
VEFLKNLVPFVERDTAPWIYMFIPTLFIFIVISYRKEKDFYSEQDSKLTPAMIIVLQCIVISAISIFFAYFFEEIKDSGTPERYLPILKYWALNNLYATIGIKGSHKLVE